MNTFVFLGPSLNRKEAEQLLAATYLPPVAMGDVYRLTRDQAVAGDQILIVDGVFEQVPAVWHKEILFALSRGIHVFGAASMGALRAAELHPFGMQGVGKIFEWYRTGEIEDDDEVAVSHSFSERGFTVTSEAMVNIRAALAEATATEVIGEQLAQQLVGAAKATFYPDRVWPTLLQSADAPAAEIDRLKKFIRTRRPNQKRDDALAALALLADRQSVPAQPHAANFQFEQTSFWVGLTRTASGKRLHQQETNVDHTLAQATLSRLKSDTNHWRQQRQRALLRHCIESLGEAISVGDDEYQAALAAFCRQRQLHSSQALHTWLAEREIAAAEFKAIILFEAKVQYLTAAQTHRLDTLALEACKCAADYPVTKAAAEAGVQLLAALGINKPSLADTSLSAAQLQQWFEDSTQQTLNFAEPYLRSLGIQSARDLIDEMIVQYLQQHHQTAQNAGQPAA